VKAVASPANKLAAPGEKPSKGAARWKLHPVARYPGIYRRGDSKKGSYVVVITLRGARGQKKKTCRTLAEAIQVQADLRKSASSANSYRIGVTPFDVYALNWVKKYHGSKRGGIKEQSRLEFERMFQTEAFKKAFGGVRLVDVTVDHLNHYTDILAASDLAASTIKNRLTPIKRCLALAAVDGHIAANPAYGYVPSAIKNAKKKEVRALSEDELTAVRAACSMGRNSTLMSLLVDFLWQTGLRIGEALALDRRHLDLKKEVVRVKRRIYRPTPGDPSSGFAPPKSKHGIRSVPLSPEMCERLRAYCGNIALDEPIFRNDRRSRRGQRLTYSGVRNRFDRLLAKGSVTYEGDNGQTWQESLDWVTFHMLRHTCASYLLRRRENGGLGLNAREAQHWLGHHSATFTMDVYAQFFADDMPEALGFDDVMTRITKATQASAKGQRVLHVVKAAS
jgi:integrase